MPVFYFGDFLLSKNYLKNAQHTFKKLKLLRGTKLKSVFFQNIYK